jgi:hypothetical protein
METGDHKPLPETPVTNTIKHQAYMQEKYNNFWAKYFTSGMERAW